MSPFSHTSAKRSTSGSTTTPKSAFSRTIASDIWVRFSGSGSGLWANCPFGSQFNSTTSQPSSRRSCGITTPPTELTASTTTLNLRAHTASRSTSGNAITCSIWRALKSSHDTTRPIASTSGNTKFSSSASASTRLPSASLRNSPRSLSSFRAFHCLGLCDAVMMIPPSALCVITAISVPGVVHNPTFITSAPQPVSVPSIMSFTMWPEIRASRPTTMVSLLPLCFSLMKRT